MIEQTIFIPKAKPNDVYSALLNSKLHTVITGEEAVINPVINGKYTTYGGYASGIFTSLKANESIEQTWRASDWPKDHYSKVIFNFTDQKDGTNIHFIQSNLPAGSKDEFVKGWNDYYWEPLIKYFAKEDK